MLTYQGDLWLNRLADGGAALPHDPLKETASLCEGETRAQLGWAVGYGASTAEASFVLPADPLSPDPTVSRFTATVTLGYSGMPGIAFGPLAARSLPPPLDYVAPSIETLHLELERTFDGILDLGTVGGSGGRAASSMFNTAVIDPSDELEEEAVLWLVCDGYDERTIGVRDDRGEAWQAEAEAASKTGGSPSALLPRPPARSRTCPSSGGSASMSVCSGWAGSARPPGGPRRRARTPAMPRPRARPPPLPRSRSRRPRPRAPRPAACSSRESCTGWTST